MVKTISQKVKATIFTDFREIPLWLQELLPPNQRIEKWDRGNEMKDNTIVDQSILICKSREESFVAHCERRGFRYGVISINDENLENYMGYATSSNCKFVIRGYYHPHLDSLLKSLGMSHKLLHIYPGVSDSFFKELSSAEIPPELSQTWFFAGEDKPTRKSFLENFHCLSGGKVLLTREGFQEDNKKKTALTTSDYCNLLRSSIFAPCPTGWVNIDTYRFYESLHAGCIPVVLINACPEKSDLSYWEAKFRPSRPLPFVQAKNWKEARKICEDMITNNSAIDARKECQYFWLCLRNHWRIEIKKFFEGSWDK